MILSGHEIQSQIRQKLITIDPPDDIVFNSASVDLTLGSEVAVYTEPTHLGVANHWAQLEKSAIHHERHKAKMDNMRPTPDFGIGPYDGRGLASWERSAVIDMREPPDLRKWTMDPEVGWILQPGVCYLMHTAERIHTEYYVPVLDGKSSIGRLFVKVHETAGFGDPGFDGQYTLEVTSQFPVRVFPGMRFCQIRFHTIQGEVTSYQKLGRYKGDAAKGAIGSRIHETFPKPGG